MHCQDAKYPHAGFVFDCERAYPLGYCITQSTPYAQKLADMRSPWRPVTLSLLLPTGDWLIKIPIIAPVVLIEVERWSQSSQD